MTAATCRGCGTTLRSKLQWICKGCIDAAERAFRVDHAPADPDWIAARNATFGSPGALLAAVAAGRALMAVA